MNGISGTLFDASGTLDAIFRALDGHFTGLRSKDLIRADLSTVAAFHTEFLGDMRSHFLIYYNGFPGKKQRKAV
jgi:hypothetical protein